jgi:hypothetical protein
MSHELRGFVELLEFIELLGFVELLELVGLLGFVELLELMESFKLPNPINPTIAVQDN